MSLTLNIGAAQSIFSFQIPWNLTGLVTPSTPILAQDTFSDGLNGWVPLFTPFNTSGTRWATVSRVFRGAPHIQIRTAEESGLSGAMIKRMTHVYGPGKYLVEFLAHIENVTAELDRPASFDFGVDTCLQDGTRRYFQLRFLNYDENAASQVQKFQLNLASGFTDIVASGVFPWMTYTNENKLLPTYIALLVNTATGNYEGVRVNNIIKLGALATPSDTTIQGLGPPPTGSLLTFSNGLNPAIAINNRASATHTTGCVGIQFHRTTYLGT